MLCSGYGHCSQHEYLCSFIYCSSGNWQSPSLCYQATKTAPASEDEQTNQGSQRRSFTWLASKIERGLSGLTQDGGCWNQHQSWRELGKSESLIWRGQAGWEWSLKGHTITLSQSQENKSDMKTRLMFHPYTSLPSFPNSWLGCSHVSGPLLGERCRKRLDTVPLLS